ncbi:unnamed protein product [Allacma fusca]|uniref:Carboxylesterase type B domain-containing protein n=1 Tax=Allacma fusca TaxID=39272 RepID=A0A8J2JMN2_9HEXA|nr:unnamed protein product [Allacma fusca]
MFLGCLANANAWLPVCLHLGVLLFLSCPHSCLPQAKYSTRLVETAYGSVRGIIIPRSGSLTRDVEGFLGVPYASAPAASLRFMPPLTPSHWKGVRVADKYGPVCPQLLPDISNRTHSLSRMPLLKYTRLMEISQMLSNQSEDCLYLNIMIPVKDRKKDKCCVRLLYGKKENGESLEGRDDLEGERASMKQVLIGGIVKVLSLPQSVHGRSNSYEDELLVTTAKTLNK